MITNKLLLALSLLFIMCNAANAQIQHQQQNQQPKEQLYFTTAYYKQGHGYFKLLIRVAIDLQGILRIKQVYQQNVTGGQWQNVNSTSYTEKCISMSFDNLESQFMYKC